VIKLDKESMLSIEHQLLAHCSVVCAFLQAYFSKWPDSGEVDLKKEFSNLIAKTAARTLLGREIREQLFDQVSTLAAPASGYLRQSCCSFCGLFKLRVTMKWQHVVVYSSDQCGPSAQ
jgi:hypothetical protein